MRAQRVGAALGARRHLNVKGYFSAGASITQMLTLCDTFLIIMKIRASERVSERCCARGFALCLLLKTALAHAPRWRTLSLVGEAPNALEDMHKWHRIDSWNFSCRALTASTKHSFRHTSISRVQLFRRDENWGVFSSVLAQSTVNHSRISFLRQLMLTVDCWEIWKQKEKGDDSKCQLNVQKCAY